LMFKADQVDALKEEVSQSMDQIDLGPSDSGMSIGLADSKAPSGTGSLTLGDSSSSKSGTKEDTALAADLGLSGSLGGLPSPARSSAGSVAGMGSQRSSMNVFHEDEVEDIDPSAQTAVSPGISEPMMDAVGSGSGLLDLTKESDDTSLGAELLDEIAPSGTGIRRSPGDSASGAKLEARARGKVISSGQVTITEKHDPLAVAFGAMALGAAIVAIFGAFVLITAILGTHPDILDSIYKLGHQFIYVAGGGIAVALVCFIIGMIVSKAMTK
jgi:hypothetical protein